MGAVTRKFKVTYGAITIGRDDSKHPSQTGEDADNGARANIDSGAGKLRVSQTVENFSIDFNFILTAPTAAILETETNAIELAFKPIRQSVVININDSVAWTFSHSDNTGYNSRATLSKTGGASDGGFSRQFSLHIEVGLPFNDASLSGRRSSQISVSYSANRRAILNISGEYCGTAGGAESATEKYDSEDASGAVNTWVNTVRTFVAGYIGGTPVFERTSEDFSYDDQNKILNFTITEEEILYKQGQSVTDDADLFNQNLTVQLNRNWPGDSPPGTGRYKITRAIVQYSCQVRKSSDPTGSPTDLEVVYFNKIRPFIINEAYSATEFFGLSSSMAIVDESVSYDKNANAISCSFQADLITSSVTDGDGQTVLSKRLTINDEERLGVHLVPVWSTGDEAEPHLKKYKFDGPGSHVRSVTCVYRVLEATIDDKDKTSFLGGERFGRMIDLIPNGDGWIQLDQRADATVLEVGVPQTHDSRPYVVTDYTISATSERYEEVPLMEEVSPGHGLGRPGRGAVVPQADREGEAPVSQ